jgi:SAM-dependent methyltransferase
LCFDSELWYRRSVFGAASLVAVLAIAIVLFRDNVQPIVDEWDDIFVAARVATPTIPDFLDSITLEIVLYLAAMFAVCMLCHGELVRSKPNPRYLTLFYLCLSAGGALGGMFVALLCPLIFPDYIESYIFLIGGALLGLFVLFDSWTLYERRWREWWQALVATSWLFASGLMRTVLRRPVENDPARQVRMAKSASLAWRGRPWYTLASLLVPLPVLAVLLLLYHAAEWPRDPSLVSCRSFYGVLHVSQYDLDTDDQRRNLYNGRILHGIQLTAPGRTREPTTYYNHDSGVGLTLLNLAQLQGPLRVATVGLGTGTIAAYGQAGDYYCFYEINPDVIDIAHDYFTFLGDSPAQVEVVEGDARLSLERQAPQGYDVIALDAFSGDAIPAHLLTVEAVATYLRHLKPSGVLAVHTSNRHLDLVPIATLLAIHHGLQIVSVDCDDYGGIADSSSEWLLMTRNEEFLNMPDVSALSEPLPPPGDEIRVWTDQYSNLFQILRNWHDEEDEE